MAEQKKTRQTHQSDLIPVSLKMGLGVPPLKMVLVNAENDRMNAALKPKQITQDETQTPQATHVEVTRIIAHLKKKE